MPVISLSLPDSMLRAMDEIQDSVGFSGRSELVRTAIRLLLDDVRQKNALEGEATAVIVVGHSKEDEEPVTRLKHRFEDIVKTHIHCKVSREDCIEVFVLAGRGQQMASMAKQFQRERKIRSVKLITL